MKPTRFATLFLTFAFLVAPAWAQTGGGGSGGRPTGGGGGGGAPGPTRTPTSIPTPTPSQPQQPQMQRPIFMTGSVVMADGTPVPRGIEIHRNCNGRDRREGYADSTGHFSFQLGQDMTIQDASSDSLDSGIGGGMGGNVSNGMPAPFGSTRGFNGAPNLMGCELKAVAAGFRSSRIELSTYRSEEPEVGTLVLERYEKVPGTMISATTAAAPKDAQKAFKKGLDAIRKGKSAEAEQRLVEATTLYPRFAEAWYELGAVYMRQNNQNAAKHAFEQALNGDPKYVLPYVSLASIAAMKQDWAQTQQFSQQAITLDPIDFPNGYFLDSVASFNLGKIDQAEKSARKAASLDPRHQLPHIQSLLGRILMVKGDYPGALASFRNYLNFSPNASDAADIRRQVQTLEQAQANPPSAPAAHAQSAPAPPQN